MALSEQTRAKECLRFVVSPLMVPGINERIYQPVNIVGCWGDSDLWDTRTAWSSCWAL
jgi:hypothetical protein